MKIGVCGRKKSHRSIDFLLKKEMKKLFIKLIKKTDKTNNDTHDLI